MTTRQATVWALVTAWTLWMAGCAPATLVEAAPEAPRPAVAGPLDALPPCEPLEPDGRIDLVGGCADGGCAWMTAAELSGVWGGAACAPSSSTPTVLCAWPAGPWAAFDDRDHDGVADPDVPARLLFLDPPYDGSTVDGLGVGASLSCFVDALGPPDRVRLESDDAGWAVRSMGWSVDGVEVFDLYGESRADSLALSGAE